jgi:hypothetical protein
VRAILNRHAGELHTRCGRFEDHRALASVHHDLRAVGDPKQLRTRQGRHRDAERARHDRGVSRDPAAGERDSRELVAMLGNVRGPQVLGHEDEG